MQEITDDDHWWARGRAEALYKLLIRHVDPQGPALDVGSGSGLLARKISGSYGPVFLVEPNLPEYSERLAAASLLNHTLVATLPGPLPFPDKAFSLVSCLDVLEHLDADESSMRELARIVKLGGHLLITVPAHPHLWSVLDDVVGHKRRYSREDFVALAESSGLHIKMISPLNVWLYPAAATVRRFKKIGSSKPKPYINQLLIKVLASEGNLAGRWPSYFRGLSWVFLGQKLSKR